MVKYNHWSQAALKIQYLQTHQNHKILNNAVNKTRLKPGKYI